VSLPPDDALPPPPPPTGPRWLYLHGFASGPRSTKGLALAAHYAARGQHLERLDLRLPSFERLRLSAMLGAAQEAMGGPDERAVLFGSSLGGLAAARVAERDARVCALVLLAPAFRVVPQLRRRLGEEAWRRWQEEGWLETEDHAEKRTARVDFGFVEDALVVDAACGGWPDVRVPTLVVHGRADDTCDVALSRRWAAGRRHVRLVEVDDGHELVASLPRIREEADAFLQNLLPPAPPPA
jgi:pimeloyl-ACP methyl ester carboxylesterase